MGTSSDLASLHLQLGLSLLLFHSPCPLTLEVGPKALRMPGKYPPTELKFQLSPPTFKFRGSLSWLFNNPIWPRRALNLCASRLGFLCFPTLSEASLPPLPRPRSAFMALCLLRGLVSALHVRIGSNSQVHLSANPPLTASGVSPKRCLPMHPLLNRLHTLPLGLTTPWVY